MQWNLDNDEAFVQQFTFNQIAPPNAHFQLEPVDQVIGNVPAPPSLPEYLYPEAVLSFSNNAVLMDNASVATTDTHASNSDGVYSVYRLSATHLPSGRFLWCVRDRAQAAAALDGSLLSEAGYKRLAKQMFLTMWEDLPLARSEHRPNVSPAVLGSESYMTACSSNLHRSSAHMFTLAEKFVVPRLGNNHQPIDPDHRDKGYALWRLHDGQEPNVQQVSDTIHTLLAGNNYLHSLHPITKAPQGDFCNPTVFQLCFMIWYFGTDELARTAPTRSVRSLVKCYGRGLDVFPTKSGLLNEFAESVPFLAWCLAAVIVRMVLEEHKWGTKSQQPNHHVRASISNEAKTMARILHDDVTGNSQWREAAKKWAAYGMENH
ncbi:hypothetical protein DENSPDRAFT_886731 [Dentipellis sp. KUC8613]|nr:hypothetical protein DENSPDRAFT_886731 [Dentipellis sp. KUC8613]